MVYDTLNALIDEIKQCPEYNAYISARELAMQNETTKNMLEEYHRLQLQAQAMSISGANDAGLLEKLQKLGEYLQFDALAADYLLAEYHINQMLGTIYQKIAKAVDLPLDFLET